MGRYDVILTRARRLYEEMPTAVGLADVYEELKRLGVIYAMAPVSQHSELSTTDIENATARCIAILLRRACRGQ